MVQLRMTENLLTCATLKRLVFRHVNVKVLASVSVLVIVLFLGKKQCVFL